MCHRKLFFGCSLDHLANAGDATCVAGDEVQSQGACLRDHVKHTAVSDIDEYATQFRNFDGGVQMGGESRNVFKCNGGNFLVLDFGADMDESCRRLECKFGDRFL